MAKKWILFDSRDVIQPVVGFPLKPRFSLRDDKQLYKFRRNDSRVVWFVGDREVGKTETYIPRKVDLIGARKLKCVVTIVDPLSNETITGERFYDELVDPTHIRRTLRSGPEQHHFSILSYNILAHRYTIRKENSYQKCPLRARQWPFRLTLVFRDIDAYQPDIICLQEVEVNQFKFCMPDGFNRDYDLRFGRKFCTVASPEGLCIAAKRATIKVVAYHQVLFEKESVETFKDFEDVGELCKHDNVAQLMRLRQGIHQKEFCLVNVHLAVDSHAEAKLFQVLYLMNAIHEFLSGDDIPIVLCGDFNMIPSSYFYNFMVNQVAPLPKFLKPSVQVAFEAKMNCFKEMVSEKNLKHCLSSLGSAYGSYKKLAADWKHLSKFMDSSLKEPVFTQLKHEFHQSGNITLHELGPRFLRTLDYIFFSEEKLTCSGLLELMEKTEVHKNCGIPNYSHPSDHVLLLALFSFL